MAENLKPKTAYFLLGSLPKLPMPAIRKSPFNHVPIVSNNPTVKFVNSTPEVLQEQLQARSSGQPSKKRRCRTSDDQLKILQRAFAVDPMPNAAGRTILAKRLGMTSRAVQVWFQNRRAKVKSEAKKKPGDTDSAPSEDIPTGSNQEEFPSQWRHASVPNCLDGLIPPPNDLMQHYNLNEGSLMQGGCGFDEQQQKRSMSISFPVHELYTPTLELTPESLLLDYTTLDSTDVMTSSVGGYVTPNSYVNSDASGFKYMLYDPIVGGGMASPTPPPPMDEISSTFFAEDQNNCHVDELQASLLDFSRHLTMLY